MKPFRPDSFHYLFFFFSTSSSASCGISSPPLTLSSSASVNCFSFSSMILFSLRLFCQVCEIIILHLSSQNKHTAKKGRVALPGSLPYYVNHFYPTPFRATLQEPDFLPRGKNTVHFRIFTRNRVGLRTNFHVQTRRRVPEKPLFTGLLAIRVLPKIRYETPVRLTTLYIKARKTGFVELFSRGFA